MTSTTGPSTETNAQPGPSFRPPGVPQPHAPPSLQPPFNPHAPPAQKHPSNHPPSINPPSQSQFPLPPSQYQHPSYSSRPQIPPHAVHAPPAHPPFPNHHSGNTQIHPPLHSGPPSAPPHAFPGTVPSHSTTATQRIPQNALPGPPNRPPPGLQPMMVVGHHANQAAVRPAPSHQPQITGPPETSSSGEPGTHGASVDGDDKFAPPAGSPWTPHKDANGRTYYHNHSTKLSSWTTPPGFTSPDPPATQANSPNTAAARTLGTSGWLQVTCNDGRKYYNNSATGITTWTVPQEIAHLADSVAPGPVHYHPHSRPAHPPVAIPRHSAPHPPALPHPPLMHPPIHRAPPPNTMPTASPALPPSRPHAPIPPLSSNPPQPSRTPPASAPPDAASHPPPGLPGTTNPLNASQVHHHPGVLPPPQFQHHGPAHHQPEPAHTYPPVYSQQGPPFGAPHAWMHNWQRPTAPAAAAESAADKAVRKFKELLAEKGVHEFSRFEKEVPKLNSDARFKAVPPKERKGIFDSYCKNVVEEQKKLEEKKSEREQAGVEALLQELLAVTPMQWRAFQAGLSVDEVDTLLTEKAAKAAASAVVVEVAEIEEGEDADEAEAVPVPVTIDRDLQVGGLFTPRTTVSDVTQLVGLDARWQGCAPELRQKVFDELIGPKKAQLLEEEEAAMRTVRPAFFKVLRDLDVSPTTAWDTIEAEVADLAHWASPDMQAIMFVEYLASMKGKAGVRSKGAKAVEARQTEAQQRMEATDQEAEKRRLKAGKADAVRAFQTLLAETVRDTQHSWSVWSEKLSRDPLKRMASPLIEQSEYKTMFDEHASALLATARADYLTALMKVVLPEIQTPEEGLRAPVLWGEAASNWTAASEQLSVHACFAKLGENEREATWRRFVSDVQGGSTKPGYQATPKASQVVQDASRESTVYRQRPKSGASVRGSAFERADRQHDRESDRGAPSTYDRRRNNGYMDSHRREYARDRSDRGERGYSAEYAREDRHREERSPKRKRT